MRACAYCSPASEQLLKKLLKISGKFCSGGKIGFFPRCHVWFFSMPPNEGPRVFNPLTINEFLTRSAVESILNNCAVRGQFTETDACRITWIGNRAFRLLMNSMQWFVWELFLNSVVNFPTITLKLKMKGWGSWPGSQCWKDTVRVSKLTCKSYWSHVLNVKLLLPLRSLCHSGSRTCFAICCLKIVALCWKLVKSLGKCVAWKTYLIDRFIGGHQIGSPGISIVVGISYLVFDGPFIDVSWYVKTLCFLLLTRGFLASN